MVFIFINVYIYLDIRASEAKALSNQKQLDVKVQGYLLILNSCSSI